MTAAYLLTPAAAFTDGARGDVIDYGIYGIRAGRRLDCVRTSDRQLPTSRCLRLHLPTVAGAYPGRDVFEGGRAFVEERGDQLVLELRVTA